MLHMALALATVLVAGGPALANDQLAGTWTTSEMHGARAGAPDHHPEGGDAFHHEAGLTFRLTVEELQSNGFHGQWCSEVRCEDLVGVVRADGETVLMADEDGTFTGTLRDGQFELCYVEADAEDRVAFCSMMTKQ